LTADILLLFGLPGYYGGNKLQLYHRNHQIVIAQIMYRWIAYNITRDELPGQRSAAGVGDEAVSEELLKQLGLSVLSLAIGIAGWLLPHRWNPLRLRRGLGSLLPEKVDLLLPKIVGTLCIAAGLCFLIATLAGVTL
jgi:hypothetical protein